MILKILISLCLFVLSASQRGRKYKCKKSDRFKICTLQFIGVCGWYNRKIKCTKYPCGKTYGTICQACSDPKVAYVTKGVCPRGIWKSIQ